jgi:putative transposase
MKYEFIYNHRHRFPVRIGCRALRVKQSGYYAWIHRPRSRRSRENEQLLKEIKLIHDKSRKTYGSPRIALKLHRKGISVSRQRVARIMRKHNLRAVTKRKFKVTTNSRHRYPLSPNLVNQNFTIDSPNKVWASDITYVRTREGWLYLTVIEDLFNREIVGWSMSSNLSVNRTTIPALIQAITRHNPGPGLIFHSDQGIQYASNSFRKLLSKNKIIQSMSGKGNCYDNAVVESFFNTLKTEHVYHEHYETRNQARQSIFEYIEIFYNRERLHSYLNYLSPEEFKKLREAA